MPSPLELTIYLLPLLLALAFFYRDSLPIIGGKAASSSAVAARSAGPNGKGTKKEDEGDPRDFVGKMERAVSLKAI
jgi:NADPH-ferrihemoprotein reductase